MTNFKSSLLKECLATFDIIADVVYNKLFVNSLKNTIFYNLLHPLFRRETGYVQDDAFLNFIPASCGN